MSLNVGKEPVLISKEPVLIGKEPEQNSKEPEQIGKEPEQIGKEPVAKSQLILICLSAHSTQGCQTSQFPPGNA